MSFFLQHYFHYWCRSRLQPLQSHFLHTVIIEERYHSHDACLDRISVLHLDIFRHQGRQTLRSRTERHAHFFSTADSLGCYLLWERLVLWASSFTSSSAFQHERLFFREAQPLCFSHWIVLHFSLPHAFIYEPLSVFFAIEEPFYCVTYITAFSSLEYVGIALKRLASFDSHDTRLLRCCTAFLWADAFAAIIFRRHIFIYARRRRAATDYADSQPRQNNIFYADIFSAFARDDVTPAPHIAITPPSHCISRIRYTSAAQAI